MHVNGDITDIKQKGDKLMASIMSIRPPDEIREKLKAYAKKKGYTVNHLVTQILWDWVNKTA